LSEKDNKPTIDIQGRFALTYDFMTNELALKIRITDPRTEKAYTATIPFHEEPVRPIRFNEGG